MNEYVSISRKEYDGLIQADEVLRRIRLLGLVDESDKELLSLYLDGIETDEYCY